MNTDKRRMRFIAVLLVIVMMICTAACSGSDTEEREGRDKKKNEKVTPTDAPDTPSPTEAQKDPTPTESQPEATPTPEPTKLTIWTDVPEYDAYYVPFQKAFAEMQKRYPDILVQVESMYSDSYKTKVRAAGEYGALPDIFLVNPNADYQEMVRNGLLCNMDDASLAYGEKLPETMRKAFFVGGKSYAVPCEMNCVVMFANMDLLAQVGYTEVPMTWDEMLECCDKLVAAGIRPFGCAGYEQWCVSEYLEFLMLRLGGRQMLEDIYYNGATWKNKAIADAVDLFLEMVEKEYFSPHMFSMDNDEVKQRFMNGEYAFYVNGTWNVYEFEYMDNYRIQAVPFPGFGNGMSSINEYIGGPVAGLAVPTASLNQDVAIPYAYELAQLISRYQFLERTIFPVWEIDYDCSDLSDMRRNLAQTLLDAEGFIYFGDSALPIEEASAYLMEIVNITTQGSYYEGYNGADFVEDLARTIR